MSIDFKVGKIIDKKKIGTVFFYVEDTKEATLGKYIKMGFFIK